MKRFAFVLVASALLYGGVASPASATPFVLDYTVTPLGPNYQYNFTLVLDNHDGSWAAGQQFDWFVIGDSPTASPFSEGSSFFTAVPAGFMASITSGGHKGPTLCYGTDCALPGYFPAAVGDAITFTGLSSTFVGAGQLLWSNLEGPSLANFETANLVPAQVPEPATLALFGAGLIGLAGAFWQRKRKAA